jgi:hypothetical protein
MKDLDFSVTDDDINQAKNKLGDVPIAINCMIMQAFMIETKKGSIGLQLDLKTINGDNVNHVIYTWSGDKNQELSIGKKDVKDLVMLLGLTDCKPQQNYTVEVYDFDLKETVKKQATAYPALYKKMVGVVFGNREYNGKIYPDVKAFYNPKTRQTLIEFLHEKEPIAVDALLNKLKGESLLTDPSDEKTRQTLIESSHDKPPAEVNALLDTVKNNNKSEQLQNQNDFDFDDDIPF